MEWEQSRESANIEDRRGEGGGFSIGGGGGGLGIGAIVILAAIGYFTGIDPRLLIGGAEILTGSGNGVAHHAPAPVPSQTVAQNDPMRRFVAKILAQTEDVWTKILPEQKGVQYIPPKLVLYSGATRSGCGQAQAAMGPFYCPNDKKVYLDMSFFNDMRAKYGGGGDFAYAYVIAHEIGHHVQDQLGLLAKVDEAKAQMNRTQANALSVRVELMADCLAGVWAYNANKEYRILDPGDVEKALATAQAIGDDRLQTASRGYAVPDSFTHGSSAARQKWLQTGLNTGQVDSCNTFRQ
ncbi:MAG TPA: neutral zinc metallopeptidase [Roseiarcus sp.]|nr:neutral zinc metallopeptidase [Roseiarcus sp.]